MSPIHTHNHTVYEKYTNNEIIMMVATTYLNTCHLSGIMLSLFCVINPQTLLSSSFFGKGCRCFNFLPPQWLIQADLILNRFNLTPPQSLWREQEEDATPRAVKSQVKMGFNQGSGPGPVLTKPQFSCKQGRK